MILKGILGIIDEFLIKMRDSNKKVEDNKVRLYTEEDILKAMDDLPVPEPEPKGYSIGELNCRVPKLGVWSSFEYLGESPSGMSPEGEKKFFYLIPAGWEYTSKLKMWYLGVHLNDSVEDVFEFYTTYDYAGEGESSGV